MRGRLINPFLLGLRQLDTQATATAGYDPDFKEPKRLQDGTSARREKPEVKIPVQVEVQTYEQLMEQASGNDPNARVTFVMHFSDLEELGLIDENGNASIRVGDRATAVYRMDDETLIQQLGLDARGYFCTEAQPQSFGLSGGERNLLLCTFENREQSYRGGG